ARGLGTEDLHHAPARQAADAERDVQPQGARGDGRDVVGGCGRVSEAHHRALAKLLLDLTQRGGERLLAVLFHLHFPGSVVVGKIRRDYHTKETRRARAVAIVSWLIANFLRLTQYEALADTVYGAARTRVALDEGEAREAPRELG